MLSRPSSRAWADGQRYCSECLLQLEKCSFMKTGAPVDKGKHLSYIGSYKKFKASRICVQWCIIIGLLIK